MTNYVLQVGNPEKNQKNVKIKYHDLKKAKMEKTKTRRVHKQSYLRLLVFIFPKKGFNLEWYLILT